MAKKQKTKKLSECMAELLDLRVTDSDSISFLEALGVRTKKQNNRTLIMARLLDKALHGDVSAMKEVRSVMTEPENTDSGLLAEILEAVKNVV